MKILVLRKINENLKSHNGTFQYPTSGLVKATDWDASPECGGGLHALPWGEGSFNIDQYGTQFMVLEVSNAKSNYVAFGGKCKFREGYVKLITQSQQVAIEYIKAYPDYPKDTVINYDLNLKQNAISGYKSTQKAGEESTQKAGYGSTQEAGYKSTQEAGYKSTQEAGDKSTQKAGDESTQKAGLNSIQIGWWYDAKANYHVKSRTVTAYMANKPYLFKQGKWTLVK